jgi:5'-phosphate synthase pdxT subunit
VIGVLALQGDVREHLHALAEADAIARPIRRPGELEAVDGLVIPGGESTTMSKLAIDFGLLDPIRALISEGMPAYGSCAGMIMLADEVLDGRPDQRGFGGIDMTVRRNAFGRQVDSFEASVDLRTGGPVAAGPAEGAVAAAHAEGAAAETGQTGAFHAVFIRAPWVERVGPSVEVLGRVATGPAAGRIVAVRQQHLLATAFHPELTGDLRVHRLFVDMVRGESRTKG